MLSYSSKGQKKSGEMAQWLKITNCCAKGPEFDSQHLHGGSHPYITSMLGDLTPSRQWFSIYLNTALHVVLTPNYKIIFVASS